MKDNIEMKIYGGKFKYVPSEFRYGVYQQTLSKTLESYNDQWAERVLRRFSREACIDVVRDELDKFQTSIKKSAAAFVKSAKPDSESKSCLDAIYTRFIDKLVEDVQQRMRDAYAAIPRDASLDEVAEEGRRTFAESVLEITVVAEQMDNLMREQLEENGSISKPKKKPDGTAIYKELLAGIPDPGEKEKKKLTALNANPTNRELIEWCWLDDEDKGPISKLAKAVGVSLDHVRKQAFEDEVGTKDYSSEAATLAFRKKVEVASEKYGYDAGKLLEEIEEVLVGIDRDARTAGDRIFDTREEAEKQRKIVEFERGLGTATEAEALKSRDKLDSFIKKVGVDGEWTKARISKAIARFDLEARTVDGREFEDRKEAALQRELSAAEAAIDLETEDAALKAKSELEKLITKLGVNGDWKLERVNAAIKRFDENARTAFGVLYDTRNEAIKNRKQPESFFDALKKAVLDISEDKFYLEEKIPQKKLIGARTFLTAEQDDGVFALMDTTLFGSAKNGFVATHWGIVWKNSSDSLSPRSAISWREFAKLDTPILEKGTNNIQLADDAKFDNEMSDVSNKGVLDVLTKFNAYCREADFDSMMPAEKPSEAKDASSQSTSAISVSRIVESLSKVKDSSLFVGEAIPAKKLANAFASMKVQEPMMSIKVLADATVWGSAKEGMVITDKAIYVKELMCDPVRFAFADLQKVIATGCRLKINGVEYSLSPLDDATVKGLAKALKCD